MTTSKSLSLSNLNNMYPHKLTCCDILLTLCLWRVGGDSVEDVDQDEEESDEESHAAGYDVRRHNETDPGDNDEQTCSKPYFISTTVTLFYFE